mmetsp:Transcript_12834/g.24672  ORF Transcript_12834/g.24672 Transcript_12834/m.24672 type:complete len:84 (+) Transcript_12834:542-793(+)
MCGKSQQRTMDILLEVVDCSNQFHDEDDDQKDNEPMEEYLAFHNRRSAPFHDGYCCDSALRAATRSGSTCLNNLYILPKIPSY